MEDTKAHLALRPHKVYLAQVRDARRVSYRLQGMRSVSSPGEFPLLRNAKSPSARCWGVEKSTPQDPFSASAAYASCLPILSGSIPTKSHPTAFQSEAAEHKAKASESEAKRQCGSVHILFAMLCP